MDIFKFKLTQETKLKKIVHRIIDGKPEDYSEFRYLQGFAQGVKSVLNDLTNAEREESEEKFSEKD